MSTDSPPSTFQSSPELEETFSISLAKWREAHPQYFFLATSSLVFYQDKLLLIQRAPTDSFPGRWENPGGGCDLEDETILHGVVRELWEETGLHATRIVRQVGGVDEFASSSGKPIVKFSFEVEVSETRIADLEDEIEGGKQEEERRHRPSSVDCIVIKLDPNEHQAFMWATEEQIVRGWFGDDDGEGLGFISEKQHEAMLKGFRLHRGGSWLL